MAFEAVLITETELPVAMTVANATGIEKGSILKLTDPNTAIITSGAVDTIAGIAAEEKIASNGITTLAVYKKGRFKVKFSGTVNAGDPLVTDTHLNHLKSARMLTAFDLSTTKIIGYSLEDATTGHTGLMDMSIESGGSGVN